MIHTLVLGVIGGTIYFFFKYAEMKQTDQLQVDTTLKNKMPIVHLVPSDESCRFDYFFDFINGTDVIQAKGKNNTFALRFNVCKHFF